MKCETCRELLLEAEPAELRGAGRTELALHLRSCPHCEALAQRILEDLGSLSDALATREPALEARTAMARALTEAARRRKRRVVRRAVWPALAAAGLASLLVSQQATNEPGVRSLPVEQAEPTRVPDVHAPVGQDYMVLGSDNSDIVIIWFF